jgi:RNA polymerase sigma factor (sigma-70 family)
MPVATADQDRSDARFEDAYRRLRTPVFKTVGKRFPWLSRDDLNDLYQGAWERVIRSGSQPKHASLQTYLTKAVMRNAMDELRRRRRRSTEVMPDETRDDEGIGAFESLAHTAPDAHLVTVNEAQLARDLVESLSRRQRDIVKMRHEWDCDPVEIQAALDISPRTYRRQLERAMGAISQRAELVRAGKWCEDLAQALDRFAGGYATEDEERLAKQHVAHCSACRLQVVRVRRGAAKAAALLPMPYLALGDGWLRAIGGLSNVKDHLAALVTRAPATEATSQIAAGGGIRGSGAVTSAIVACVIAGGGAATYCAQNGVPVPIRDLVSSESAKGESKSVREAVADTPATTEEPQRGPTEPATGDAGKDTELKSAQTQHETPTQRGSRLAPVELGFENGGDGSTSTSTSSTGGDSASTSGGEFAGPAPTTKSSGSKKSSPTRATEFGPE